MCQKYLFVCQYAGKMNRLNVLGFEGLQRVVIHCINFFKLQHKLWTKELSKLLRLLVPLVVTGGVKNVVTN